MTEQTNVATRDTGNPAAGQTPALLPAVDVVEDAAGITLYADLPGVPRDRLDLQIDADTLVIQGEARVELPEGLEAKHAEITVPRFRRAFTLSRELDTAKITAQLHQGVLTLRIPKAEHAQPRKIEVRG
ncbi:MAG TPA: Hsp20/alpha crystallin family protein [Porticoccaceae bacterium]|nr:Hsp20/alpha crystallin family protein [Porticoccaceae bacterium]